jgi:hypothetical protein
MEKSVWQTKSVLEMADNQTQISQKMHEAKRKEEIFLSENMETELLQTTLIYEVHWTKTSFLATLFETSW